MAAADDRPLLYSHPWSTRRIQSHHHKPFGFYRSYAVFVAEKLLESNHEMGAYRTQTVHFCGWLWKRHGLSRCVHWLLLAVILEFCTIDSVGSCWLSWRTLHETIDGNQRGANARDAYNHRVTILRRPALPPLPPDFYAGRDCHRRPAASAARAPIRTSEQASCEGHLCAKLKTIFSGHPRRGPPLQSPHRPMRHPQLFHNLWGRKPGPLLRCAVARVVTVFCGVT